jgi:hypothetical protein
MGQNELQTGLEPRGNVTFVQEPASGEPGAVLLIVGLMNRAHLKMIARDCHFDRLAEGVLNRSANFIP